MLLDDKPYPTYNHISPLTKAVEKNNNRCISILLTYMSYIDHDFSTFIQDLFPKLIDYKTF